MISAALIQIIFLILHTSNGNKGCVHLMERVSRVLTLYHCIHSVTMFFLATEDSAQGCKLTAAQEPGRRAFYEKGVGFWPNES